MTRTPPSDRFEDELRRVLTEEVDGPAPSRLVSRIAASRRDVEPESSLVGATRARFGPRRVPAFGFGLAALAVVVVVGGLLVRGFSQGSVTGPGSSSPVGSGLVGFGGPTAGPSQSPLVTASPPPASSSPAPSASVAPVATPAPSPTASSGPSSAPSSGPIASSTGSPSASPTASPAPVEGPPGGPIPAGFGPQSVTFISANEGWLLGTPSCRGTGTTCAAILRTTDGGRTWASIPAPATSTSPSDQGNVGVSRIRFADPLDGWVFGPELWVTHDGGATWKQLTLPGANATTQITALETSAGLVHAAFFDGSNPEIRIATSPVATDSWKVSPLKVTLGAGPVPQTQIVLHGTSGWLIQVDRTVVGGARLVNGAWTAWQPPCLDLAGPAMLAAASDSSLIGACDVGLWATPTGVHLFTSANGGGSFAEAATKVPVQDLQGITAAPASSAIVVAGRGSGAGSLLVASFDLGKTWSTVFGGSVSSAAAEISELGFTTADQGVALVYGTDEGARLLMTRDGGHTWAPVTIIGP